jgi:hypothetical protein
VIYLLSEIMCVRVESQNPLLHVADYAAITAVAAVKNTIHETVNTHIDLDL